MEKRRDLAWPMEKSFAWIVEICQTLHEATLHEVTLREGTLPFAETPYGWVVDKLCVKALCGLLRLLAGRLLCVEA